MEDNRCFIVLVFLKAIKCWWVILASSYEILDDTGDKDQISEQQTDMISQEILGWDGWLML